MNQYPAPYFNPSMMMMPPFQQGNPYMAPQMFPMGNMGPMVGPMGPMMMPMTMSPMGGMAMGNMANMGNMGMGNSMAFPSFPPMSAPVNITQPSQSLSPPRQISTSISPPQQPSPIPAASPPSKPQTKQSSPPLLNRAVTRPIPITTPPTPSELKTYESNPIDLETKYASAIKYLSDDMTHQISAVIVPGRSSSTTDVQTALNIATQTEGKLSKLMPTALWLKERGYTKLLESLGTTLSDVRDAIKIYTEMCTPSSTRSQADCARSMANTQTESFKLSQESNLYKQSIFNETNQRWLEVFRDEPSNNTRMYSLWN